MAAPFSGTATSKDCDNWSYRKLFYLAEQFQKMDLDRKKF
jgi:hypothetical protein